MLIILGVIWNNSLLFATNYYINKATGSDYGNNGLTTSTPFQHIQRGADVSLPGDTVFVMNGTYPNDACSDCNVINVSNSGDSLHYIVFTNYPGHTPKLQFNGWQGFYLVAGTAYIVIQGFIIEGNNANILLDSALNQGGSCNNPTGSVSGKFNGNGIAADYSSVHCHHIIIQNNVVYDCGGAGISAIQSDYITIRNNIVYNNCWYTIYGTSGIDLWQNWNYDHKPGYHIYIENNISFNNRLYVPWVGAPCVITDGNGIIIDDSRNTQNGSTLGAYTGRTLITNNLSFFNGGSGIHTYSSDHVDIINNTTWLNNQSPNINEGQIFANTSGDIKMYNNILVANPSKMLNSNWNNTDITYDYNLHFGGNAITITGPNCITANPMFNAPDSTLTADFSLMAGSPAIDKGLDSEAPNYDYLYNTRPWGSRVDIGAYEYIGVLLSIDTTKDRLAKTLLPANSISSGIDCGTLSPNPATDFVRVIPNGNKLISVKMTNQIGRLYEGFSNNTTISLTAFSPGLYTILLQYADRTCVAGKMVKE